MQTTTDFSVWANKAFFRATLEETLQEFPDFDFDDSNEEEIITKPPMWLFENYDWSMEDEYEGFVEYDNNGSPLNMDVTLLCLVQFLISIL